MKKEINEYFKANMNGESKIQTVWKAHKEVIRENLISLNSNDKRKKQEKLKFLQDSLKQKENELKKKPRKNRY